MRKKGVDAFLAVHDFDNDGEVLGKPQDFGSVNAAVTAEAHEAAQDRRAGDPLLAGKKYECFIKRLSVPLVRFADENP